MTKLLLFASFCALFLTGTVKSEIVGIRALALASSSDMPERYLSTKEGYELLAFKSAQPSALIKANTEERLPLFEKGFDANRKPVYRIAEQVKLPGDARSVLLLGWNSASGPSFLAIDDNFLNAEYSNWLMINTSDKPIAFQIGEGEKPFVIKPNSIKDCKISPPKGTGAAVQGKSVWNDQVRGFYSTFWPIREGERSIVIFVERGNRISVKKISDNLRRKNNE